MIFKGLFRTEEIGGENMSRVQLACEEGGFLTHHEDGDVFCASNLTDGMSSYFTISDVDGTFIQSASGPAELSFSDTIYDGVFGKLITSNIFADFVDANFAAVVLVRSYSNPSSHDLAIPGLTCCLSNMITVCDRHGSGASQVFVQEGSVC